MKSLPSKLRTRKVLVPTAVLAVLAVGGIGTAVALENHDGHDDQTLTGAEATRIGEAAQKAANLPDAVVAKVEKDDEDGLVTYEVTLDNPAGGRVEVELNSALGLIQVEDDADDSHDRGEAGDEAPDTGAGAATPLEAHERTVDGVVVDEEEGVITDAQVNRAVAAAQKAVNGGTVVSVSSNVPDPGTTGLDAREAYSVEVTTGTGTTMVEHEVDLDARFTVLRTSTD